MANSDKMNSVDLMVPLIPHSPGQAQGHTALLPRAPAFPLGKPSIPRGSFGHVLRAEQKSDQLEFWTPRFIYFFFQLASLINSP